MTAPHPDVAALARSLAGQHEQAHGSIRDHQEALEAILVGPDPTAAAWALVALSVAMPPLEWHGHRSRLDVGLPDEVAAHLCIAACHLAVRSGEARAGNADGLRAAAIGDALGDTLISAEARIQLATFAGWRDDRAAERAWLDEAKNILGNRRILSRCRALHYGAYQGACDQLHEEAEAQALEGLEVARSLDSGVFIASFLVVRALIAMDKGDLARCQRMLDEAEALGLADPRGIRRLEREALRARCDLILGRYAEADARFSALITDVDGTWPRKQGMFLAERSMARTLQGRLAEAEDDQRRATALCVGGHLEDWARSAALLIRTTRRGWEAADREEARATTAASPAGRAFQRWLRALADAPPAPSLVLDDEGVSFGAARVANAQAPVPLRLLRRLVRARLTGEGGLSVDALAEATWPGQRMLAESRQERVYATVHRLKRLGLGGLVESGPEGYRLRPDVEVVVQGSLAP